jgi:plasmid stabilization system protein ParE
MKVQFVDYAERDLEDVIEYLVKDKNNSTYAKKVLKAIKDEINILKIYPAKGSLPQELENLGLLNYKQVLVEQIRIVYQVSDQVIYIHIVCHTRRDLAAIVKRRAERM